ncbi:MAG: AAA family ATPase [Lachnospiraceae bacterium]|nr:AAA family ATPase [Lachnospiraceae bacterium]
MDAKLYEEFVAQMKEQEANIKEIEDGDEKPCSEIVLKIREWLDSTAFNSFCQEITKEVIGQEETKKILANIYNFLECIAYGKRHNNNMLLAAPSGCGKTQTYRALKKYFKEQIQGLSISQVDMTSVTEEGFKGKNTSDVVADLFNRPKDNGVGIVFMDEFDKKLIPSFSGKGSDVNAAVQNQILTLIEGRKIRPYNDKIPVEIDTNNTLFIGLGSFDSCREKKQIVVHHMGFGQENEDGEDHYTEITREDMISLGGSYELIGRFSMIINYHKLDRAAVEKIIDKALAEEIENIECDIELSDTMRQHLFDNSNSKYGCRLLKSIIHDNVMDGYLQLLENDCILKNCKIVIEDNGEAYAVSKVTGKTFESVEESLDA